MTTVSILRTLADLEAAVGARMDRGSQPSLHDRLDWFRLLLRYCPPEGAPAFFHMGDGADGVVVPLATRPGRGRALANWYTLAWAPVSWGAGEALLRDLPRGLSRLGTLRLDPVPSAEADNLASVFGAQGWSVENAPGKPNWVAYTRGLDFAGYWSARPSKLRNTVARKSKRAGLAVQIYDRFDGHAWAAYENVYANSWKPEEGSPDFLRALAQEEGAAGTLRLGVATNADGLPVAAQLWLVERGVATIHKLAYRQDQRARSPGSILSAAMFAHVLTHDRPDLVSYGLGDEGYKADWMDERREMRTLTLRNPRHPLGLASLAKAAARRLVKRRAGD